MTHTCRATHVAWYGNVAFQRGYCSHCGGYALITEGKYKCCDQLAEGGLRGQRRMIEPPARRLPPGKEERDRILREQHQQCFYCSRLFGTVVYRKAKPIALRVEWDHIIPWIYGMSNHTQNFVAACHICNQLKGSLMFNSVEEAQLFAQDKWKLKGYATEAPLLELQRDVHPEA